MAKKPNVKNQRAYGAAVLERLGAEALPAALKGPAKDFKAAHASVEAASKATEEARARRDAALEAVGNADAALDASVELLADALVGAGLGSRRQPFASFSKQSVSELVNLAYANEAKAVRALCAAIRRQKPRDVVLRAVTACEKNLQAVERAIDAVAKPQAAYAKELASRDLLLPSWTRVLARLKRHAAVAWEEEPATIRATFAPPDGIAAPKAKRAKPKTQPVTNGGGASQPTAPS